MTVSIFLAHSRWNWLLGKQLGDACLYQSMSKEILVHHLARAGIQRGRIDWRLEEFKHLCRRLGVLEAGIEWPVSGHTGQACINFHPAQLPLEAVPRRAWPWARWQLRETWGLTAGGRLLTPFLQLDSKSFLEERSGRCISLSTKTARLVVPRALGGRWWGHWAEQTNHMFRLLWVPSDSPCPRLDTLCLIVWVLTSHQQCPHNTSLCGCQHALISTETMVLVRQSSRSQIGNPGVLD